MPWQPVVRQPGQPLSLSVQLERHTAALQGIFELAADPALTPEQRGSAILALVRDASAKTEGPSH